MKEKFDRELEEIKNALGYCYFKDANEDEFEDSIFEPFIRHYNGESDVEWATGCTKGVLIFKDYGFVIKIPYRYNVNEGDEFYGASESDCGWDYCEQEARRYLAAEKNGLSKIFLKTDFWCEIDEYPIYIQPIAETLQQINKLDDNKYSKHTEKDYEKVVNINSEKNIHIEINYSWQADVYVDYGEDFFNHFIDYINEVGISDLRNANIGYSQGHPVLIDYAGYSS